MGPRHSKNFFQSIINQSINQLVVCSAWYLYSQCCCRYSWVICLLCFPSLDSCDLLVWFDAHTPSLACIPHGIWPMINCFITRSGDVAFFAHKLTVSFKQYVFLIAETLPQELFAAWYSFKSEGCPQLVCVVLGSASPSSLSIL